MEKKKLPQGSNHRTPGLRQIDRQFEVCNNELHHNFNYWTPNTLTYPVTLDSIHLRCMPHDTARNKLYFIKVWPCEHPANVNKQNMARAQTDTHPSMLGISNHKIKLACRCPHTSETSKLSLANAVHVIPASAAHEYSAFKPPVHQRCLWRSIQRRLVAFCSQQVERFKIEWRRTTTLRAPPKPQSHRLFSTERSLELRAGWCCSANVSRPSEAVKAVSVARGGNGGMPQHPMGNKETERGDNEQGQSSNFLRSWLRQSSWRKLARITCHAKRHSRAARYMSQHAAHCAREGRHLKQCRMPNRKALRPLSRVALPKTQSSSATTPVRRHNPPGARAKTLASHIPKFQNKRSLNSRVREGGAPVARRTAAGAGAGAGVGVGPTTAALLPGTRCSPSLPARPRWSVLSAPGAGSLSRCPPLAQLPGRSTSWTCGAWAGALVGWPRRRISATG